MSIVTPGTHPRSALRGNQNARKHGFYSQFLDKSQQRNYKQAASREVIIPLGGLQTVEIMARNYGMTEKEIK